MLCMHCLHYQSMRQKGTTVTATRRSGSIKVSQMYPVCDAGVIAGAVMGGLAAVAIVCGVTYLAIKNRQRHAQSDAKLLQPGSPNTPSSARAPDTPGSAVGPRETPRSSSAPSTPARYQQPAAP